MSTTTGKKTPPGKDYSKPLPPDDPIYKRGFVIGSTPLKRSPNATPRGQKPPPPKEK